MAPGFTPNNLVPAPENVVVHLCPLAPLPLGEPHSLYPMSSQQGNCLSPCGPKASGLHTAPGDSPFPPEHCQLMSCTVSDSVLPLLIESSWNLNPLLSPFSLFSSVLVAVSTFPLSLELLFFEGGCFSCILTPHPVSILPKWLPAHSSFSLPLFTSPRHAPAEFCGSGCVDCCVHPQMSFLGVQHGLSWSGYISWMGDTHKTSMLFPHLGSSPRKNKNQVKIY